MRRGRLQRDSLAFSTAVGHPGPRGRLCLAVGVWGLFRVTGKSGLWTDGYDLTVVAADAQDVEPGTPVRVRGVEAGRVTGVDVAGDEVHISVRLDGKFRDKIYADSSAAVQTKGILGVSVVDIKPGTSPSRALWPSR